MILIKKALKKLQSISNSVINTVLPPRCIISGDIVEAPGMVSPTPWARLNFIEHPFCDICGRPFEFITPDESVCGDCFAYPPEFTSLRSALVYDENISPLILGFKYGDKLHAKNTFAKWMIRAARDTLPDCDLIIPVPLHYSRLWKRRYNQAGEIGKEISVQTNITFIPDVLKRNRFTQTQKGLTTKQRQDNVKSSFKVRPLYLNQIKGKKIIIIDDVYTSGATLNECAKTLNKQGAKTIHALTLARVVK